MDFWFDFGSTYSYVAALRVEAEAAASSVELRFRPFLLGPIFEKQLGIKDSPFNVRPERRAYMWRDLERLCARYGLPWRKPSVFPRHSVAAARVACIDASWRPTFVRAVFRANFAEDRDISDRGVLAALLEHVGAPAGALEEAESAEVRSVLRGNTAEAMEWGFFGAPDFTVGRELFFGQDRLGDALEWAKRS